MDNKAICDHIIALERAALEEWNQGNPSAYLELYAEDIVYFDPEQRINGLDAMRAYYEPIRGKIKVDRYEMLNPRVCATDKMAVLSYNLTSHVREGVWRWNCTEVYRLEQMDDWKIVHNHWSLIKP